MSQTPERVRRLTRVRPRVPERDRKRIAKACQTCRDRKSRCIVARRDAQGLICQRCLQKGIDCVFERSTPGAHAAGAAWPTVISPARNNDGRGHGASEDTEAPRSARLVVKNSHQTHYVGEISNGTFLYQVQDAVASNSPGGSSRGIQSVSPVVESLTIPGLISYQEYSPSLNPSGIDPIILCAVHEVFPPRNVASFLVQVFFDTVEANYYYMDRDEFKARLQSWYENSATQDFDPSFVCLCLIVFAMASQFAELQEPRWASRPPPAVSEYGPGMVFYQKAKLLLSDVLTQCSLESIQACFLMGLFLLPTNISDLSYVYHGMALKMAISAGLHREIADSNLDQRVTQVRNRLWWSLYTSERRLTIILDRPESIREGDIDAPVPESSEYLDSDPSGNGIANLQAAIALTRIFNHVVHVGKTAGFDTNTPEGPAHIQKLLDEWAENLPLCLQLGNLNPDRKPFRGTVHLHMNYHQVVMYMGRKSLLRSVRRHVKNRHGNTISGPSPLESTDGAPRDCFSSTLVRNSVSAAFKTIELVNYMWENDKLARFSFTDLNCCSTAAIIIMMNETVRRHPLYQSSMEIAMRSMAHMATGCQNAKQAYKLIQNLQQVIAEFKAKDPRRCSNAANPDENPENGYMEWKRWLELVERGTTTSDPALARPQADVGTSARKTPTGSADPCDSVVGADPNCAGASEYSQEMNPPGEMNGPFYTWPENLDSLGLSGFGDFGFLTF